MVSHLHNPGPGAAFGAVEDLALALDMQKQVLDQVFRLGCVSQDARGHASRQACIALKENCESFPVPHANLTKQGFVRDLCGNGGLVSVDTAMIEVSSALEANPQGMLKEVLLLMPRFKRLERPDPEAADI